MQNAIAGSLKVRTAQYVNYSALVDRLELSYELEVELQNALSRNITWGDADVTLVSWSEVLNCYLEAVERDWERLGRAPNIFERLSEGERFKRILPNSDFGPLFINLEG